MPAGGRLDRIELAVTRANDRPCLAAYLLENSVRRPYGVMVLDIAGGEVTAITGFPDGALFRAFGLD